LLLAIWMANTQCRILSNQSGLTVSLSDRRENPDAIPHRLGVTM
jgi:hypothetical protein